jgi:serine/threonine-protein kinase
MLHGELAAGGMATVHIGRLVGPAGFGRTVAIKRLHAQFAKDPEFVSMFLDEARLAGRIRHPNVVSTLDVVVDDGEVFLVMEYVHGESLSRLAVASKDPSLVARARAPLPIVIGIMVGILHGLHAAHEACDEHGDPLRIVHRDVSPQNILVGVDGIARLLDFGVAKAAWRLHSTRDTSLKGKLRYMAPEQLRGEPIDRRVDVFSASIVLWEMLTGLRLFQGEDPSVYVNRLRDHQLPSPRSISPDLPVSLEAIVMRGLAGDREDRFATARDLAAALEDALKPATAREIGQWVERAAGAGLRERAAAVLEVERNAEALPTPAVPSSVAVHLEEANARKMRARMATDVSLQGQDATHSPAPDAEAKLPSRAADTVTEGTETTLSAPVHSSVRQRRRRPVLVVGLGFVAACAAMGVWAVWPNAHPTGAVTPPASPSSLATKDVPSSNQEAPTAASPTIAPESAPGPVDHADRSTAPRTSPTARPNRLPPSPPKPKPTASGKPPLCMKQRADGIVYFEPCE